jgi:hypothetical protein
MSIRLVTRHGQTFEAETLPDRPGVVAFKKKKRTPFLYEDIDRLVLGLNAMGRVWVYILRQHKMRPHKPIAVSSKHLRDMGVDRRAKTRAIESLAQAGLITILYAGRGRSPRVKLLV